MPAASRLLKVGSMTESLGVYVSATVFQRVLGLGRMVLFIYLLKEAQYGLWSLGAMIFVLGSALATLGSHHGLIRYVSFYEARGQLRAFARRVLWCVLACAAVFAVLSFAGSGVITRNVLVSGGVSSGATYQQYLYICWAALANAVMLALYHNMMGFLAGMRLYRLISLIEVVFALGFTAIGAGSMLVWPQALTLLVAHLASLAVALVFGMALLERGIVRSGRGAGPVEPSASQREAIVPEPGSDTLELDAAMPIRVGETGRGSSSRCRSAKHEPAGFFVRVLRFGFVAMLAGFLWQAACSVSFWLTYYEYGEAMAGVFGAFLLMGQSMFALGNAGRAVIFTHVAKLWEDGQRRLAVSVLETACKALTLGTLSLTVLIYLTCPAWVNIFPKGYRMGIGLIGGLLMFFQSGTGLALINSLARLHERPVIVALGPLAGGAVNIGLAIWWIPKSGPVGAAWAAGVGMYVGMLAVSVIYLSAARVRMHPSTYFFLAAPAVLLLPKASMGVTWAAVLGIAVFTPWVFGAGGKRLLRSSASRILDSLRNARRRQ